ncbi:uncharacterized protein [Montipora foliosa]|uniref:uncharacterized protein n=1 Tax=Montipora foliosa TaxID=591990 RepID=UPI0035F131B8
MRIDDTTASPPQDGNMDVIFTSTSDPSLEKSGVRSLDCGENCLNGIKWPPEDHTKNTSGRKGKFTVNGLRINSSMITHGGRTLKKPARYVESDSDEGSTRRKFYSAKKRKRLLSESSRPKNTTLYKNSRTKSLDGESCGLVKGDKTIGDPLLPKRQNGVLKSMEYEFDLASSSGVVLSLSTCSDHSRSQPTESLCLKRTLNDHQIDSQTSNSIETPPIKRKRGRPPTNPSKLNRFHSVDKRSPHGNCALSATNASLASPSSSKYGKKKKLSKGIRNFPKNCLSSSSDDSEPATVTPKRRGRPPTKKLLSSCETKHEIVRTQNGVKKSWVRPVLKAVDKRTLLKPSKKSLEFMLRSPGKLMTKVNSKFVRVNGCRILSSAKEIKRKRGRPPKQKPELCFETNEIDEDEFHFTDDDSQERLTQGLKSKLNKLKLQRKVDKGPLAATYLKKSAARKLKLKALEKARRTHFEKNELENVQSLCGPTVESEESSDFPHKRRRRNKADKVLGMRRNVSGTYEYLVQWKDGTSSWAPSNELVDYEMDLKCFLGHELQETTVVNRLPYCAYWHDDLILHHSNQAKIDRLLSTDDANFQMESTPDESNSQSIDAPVDESHFSDRHYLCKEVSVQKLDDCAHVIISRTSSKRQKINQRILDAVTLAMEEAAIDESKFVVLSGLGDESFCGVDLKDLLHIPCEKEARHYRRDVDKIRYLAQVLIDFPKPVVAALKKPAQGLGAKLVSLCDLVCEETSLCEPVSLQNVSKGRVPYCFTRLMGHTLANQEIIVGHKVPASKLDCVNSASEVFSKTRYTANMSASLKAMAVSGTMVYDDGLNPNGVEDEFSELEQQLLQEKNKARECIGEIQDLWNDVVSQEIFL